MNEPNMPQKKPYVVELKANQPYLYCRCGNSTNQPFCDKSSHKGTGMIPEKFTVETDGTYRLCGCKKTKNAPFCDQTHKSL
jgi:CDGSH iron-sulfur domain-containing protein 3